MFVYILDVNHFYKTNQTSDWWIQNEPNIWLVNTKRTKHLIGEYKTNQTFDWWIQNEPKIWTVNTFSSLFNQKELIILKLFSPYNFETWYRRALW